MTDCPRGDIRDLLPELVHGTLDAEIRIEVERHVAGCAECAAEVELLCAMRSALSHSPTVDMARITAAVQELNPSVRSIARSSAATSQSSVGTRHSKRHWQPKWSDWRAVAAIAAVAVGVMSYGVARGRMSTSAERFATARLDSSASRLAAAPRASGRPESGAVFSAPQSSKSVTSESSPVYQQAPAATVAQVTQGLSIDGGVGDLPDRDVQMLLQTLDSLDSVPAEEPLPVIDPVNEKVDSGEGTL